MAIATAIGIGIGAAGGISVSFQGHPEPITAICGTCAASLACVRD